MVLKGAIPQTFKWLRREIKYFRKAIESSHIKGIR